ncbi:hypothetical protein ONZ45_g12386 [Pleurotus djamor]|nr:hypothetical protein ONZ45_g12386 [Pleurotus djamor]
MHYSDGTSDIFVTDDSWKTLQRTPPGSFSRKSFNDRSWTPAYVQGGWDQIGSTWGQPTLPPVLPLENSRWIWTSDNDLTSAPVGSRGFRRTVSNRKKRAVCATALIAADNLYTLYVNGRVVGSGTDWTIADAWYIPNLDPVTNTFAVNATNVGAQAGLIAIIIITYTDGSNAMITTDASWRSVKSIPSDFAERLFHDRHWENASVIGNYGASPWNQLTLPLATDVLIAMDSSSTQQPLGDYIWHQFGHAIRE